MSKAFFVAAPPFFGILPRSPTRSALAARRSLLSRARVFPERSADRLAQTRLSAGSSARRRAHTARGRVAVGAVGPGSAAARCPVAISAALFGGAGFAPVVDR